MNFLKLDTIFKRIIIPSISFATTLLIIFGIIIAALNNSSLQTMLESKVLATNSILKNISIDFISNYDYESIQKFADQTAKDRDITHVRFLSLTGQIIASSKISDIDSSSITFLSEPI